MAADAAVAEMPSRRSQGDDARHLEHLEIIHSCFGHPSFELLGRMFSHFVKEIDLSKVTCDTCQLAKHKPNSFKGTNDRRRHPFYVIHSDVWGPFPSKTESRARWFIVLVDDCTRLTWVHLLKSKMEIPDVVKNFFSIISNQFGIPIKRFRSNNVTDYFSTDLASFFKDLGAIQESSYVYTPQQNSLAEREIGHLMTVTRAQLIHQHVPAYLWGEAVLTATYRSNRIPST